MISKNSMIFEYEKKRHKLCLESLLFMFTLYNSAGRYKEINSNIYTKGDIYE